MCQVALCLLPDDCSNKLSASYRNIGFAVTMFAVRCHNFAQNTIGFYFVLKAK